MRESNIRRHHTTQSEIGSYILYCDTEINKMNVKWNDIRQQRNKKYINRIRLLCSECMICEVNMTRCPIPLEQQVRLSVGTLTTLLSYRHAINCVLVGISATHKIQNKQNTQKYVRDTEYYI